MCPGSCACHMTSQSPQIPLTQTQVKQNPSINFFTSPLSLTPPLLSATPCWRHRYQLSSTEPKHFFLSHLVSLSFKRGKKKKVSQHKKNKKKKKKKKYFKSGEDVRQMSRSITAVTQYVCTRLKSDYLGKKKRRLRSNYLVDHIKNYCQNFYICKPTKDLELQIKAKPTKKDYILQNVVFQVEFILAVRV